MKRAIQIAGLVWLIAGVVSAAQKQPKEPPPKPLRPPPAARVAPPKGRGNAVPGGVPKRAGKLQNPENPIDRLRTMTSEERERVIERFPPKQQENIRRRLANFDNLPDAQKKRQLERYDVFHSLAPDKQQLVRQQMNAFNGLPDDRRKAVRGAYARLSSATPEERARILARPQFRARFSPEELQMLTVLPEYWPLPKKQ